MARKRRSGARERGYRSSPNGDRHVSLALHGATPNWRFCVTTIATELPRPSEMLSGWLTLLLATACGLIVANLYYAQPLVGPIARDLGLSPQAAGLIVAVTQLGYCAGLLLIVPLGDLVENRRLVLGMTSLGALALLGAALPRIRCRFSSRACWSGSARSRCRS